MVVYLHGYIHCMPYGKVSFVMRELPLQPGYEMTLWAEVRAAKASVMNTENIFVDLIVGDGEI